MPAFKHLTLTSTLLVALSFPNATASALLTTRKASTTGPYPTTTTSFPKLPSHTIYAPSNFSAVPDTIPVLIWGNNACSTTGDPYKVLNEELASWGMLVLACGAPVSALRTIPSHAGEGEWANIDGQKIGMLGTSCGGVELYTAAEDERVLSLAVLDTGSASTSTQESRRLAANATKPVLFFSTESASARFVSLDGGEGVKGEFDAIAKGVPAWYGVLPGTDVGTLDEGGAGKMGRAVRFWAQWMVAGNEMGSEFFVDAAGAESEGWTVVRKGLDVLVS